MRKRVCSAFALVAACAIGGAALLAQPPQQSAAATPQPPAAAAPQQPSFRADTVAVEVDVIVRDGSRRFVRGLTAADFEITEGGKPQQVQTLYLVEGRSVTPLPARPGGDAPVTAVETVGQAPAPAAAPPRVFVLFFDQEHLDANGFKRLQDAAVDFLKTQFQQGDVGGVLMGQTMVGNKLMGDREALIDGIRTAKFMQAQQMRKLDLQDWPRITEIEATRIALVNDRNVLAQVVDRCAREGSQSSGGRGAVFDCEPLARQKASEIVSQLRPAAARTTRILLALVNGLSRVPGRKTVVLLSDGFWVEESWSQLREIVGTASRSDVRFYSIDAQGLRRGSDETPLGQLDPNETGTSMSTAAFNTIEDGPNSIAVDTGGYVIRRTNDFKRALTEIAEDTSSYYVLGYTPAGVELDGKYHTISVRVKRPGVEVRARRGYVARAPAAPGTTPGAAAPAPVPGVAAATAAPPVVAGAAAAPAAQPAAVPAAPAGAAPHPDPPDPADPAAVALPAMPPVTLRPDSSRRVEELAAGAPATAVARELASKGWDRYRKGDLEGAEQFLGQAARQGAAPWVSYALGFAQVGVRKPADAIQSWERVLAAAPDFLPVYLDLADLYVQGSHLDRAVGTLRDAEKRWPSDSDVLNALGTVQVRRGALTDAVDTFERAARANPQDEFALFNLGRTYELRYFAMRRFSRPTSRWVDSPELLNKAVENYEACTRLGGPNAEDARAAIDRLRNLK